MGEQKLIAGEVETSSEVLARYSRDASIFSVKPAAVCYPKDDNDLKKLVAYATEQRRAGYNISLTARNGGTCMSGGPLTESIVVDMSRHFNHVGKLNVHGRTLAVEGGVMHRDIEAATHPHGLYFAPYTSSHDICGIGGMLGNNASGEKSVKFGAVSANVDELRVLLSDGNVYEFGPLTTHQVEQKKQLDTYEGQIYRQVTHLLSSNKHLIRYNHPKVKKNAAGFALWELWDKNYSHLNLARLFIGAQGTLGIITQAELKLIPMPKHQAMLIAPIKELSDLTPVVKTMLSFDPETCETYDHFTYELAKKYFPADAVRAKIADGQHLVVFAVYTGDSAAHAKSQAKRAEQSLLKIGYQSQILTDQSLVESHLLIRRKSFKMLLDHPHDGKHALAFLEDTIVPLEHYDRFLASLEAILKDYNMTYTYAGHIGDGSIRLIPLASTSTDEARAKVLELANRVYELTLAFGGSISADHNDGLIRTPFLERMYGAEMVDLFAQVKNIFDPVGIFNPRKKVGGSFDYTLSKITKR